MSKASGGKTSADEARRIADKYFRDGDAPVVDEPARPGATPPAEKKLTAKEGQFVIEYLVDLNATQAAIRAGYSKKTAAAIGYENLRKPHIRAAITFEMKEREKRTKWTAQKLLDRLIEEATADLAEIYNEDGSVKPVHEWPLIFRQGLVAGLEVEERTEDDGATSVRVAKFKMPTRIKHLELIGKHIGIQAFKEKVEHDVSNPLKELYAQIAGVGIRPMSPAQAPGLPKPAPSAIRPVDLTADKSGDEEP